MKMRLAAIGAGLAVVAAGAVTAVPAGGTFAGDEGVIVYVDGIKSGPLVSILPDGTGQTTLPLGSNNSFPSFSPSGSTLVFNCGRAICTANADGSKKKKIVNAGRWPGFSADGDQLVYVKGKDTLVVAKANGKKPVELDEAGEAWQPEFSSSGVIVFSKKVDDGREIYSIEPDGSKLKQISKGLDGYEDVNPSASPNGKSVIFERHEVDFELDTGAVISIKLNGKGESSTVREAGTPAFSPTGQRIVFQDFGEPTFHLVIATKHGSSQSVLVDEGDLSHPAWQPTEP